MPENSPPGTSVLTVEASDRDRGTFGQLDFFLAANSELFTLDSKGNPYDTIHCFLGLSHIKTLSHLFITFEN